MNKYQKFKKNLPHNTAMSIKTKEFLKRICYNETVSVDMTRNGFIRDSKAHISELLNKATKTNKSLSIIDDKHEAMKKDKTFRKMINRQRLVEYNADKHEGPKITPKKFNLKSYVVPKTKSKNNFDPASPRKIRKI